MIFLFQLILLAGWQMEARADSTYYVSASNGNDSASGASPEAAFKTIQKACDQVQAGDTVIAGAGVYLEHPQLRTLGTQDHPITFKTDKIEKNRVIVSAAIAAVRNKETAWQLDDAKLQLYSIPLAYEPARMLYDHVDLCPYPTLDSLKNFRFPDNYPGVKAGFAQENGRLYVRLRADGKYGPSDPNQHTMAVADAPIGAYSNGMGITGPKDYIWGVGVDKPRDPSYVVMDGFTFETPGCVAIYPPGGYFTVRNCWFFGCRAGLSGLGYGADQSKMTDHVTVEYCDITQFPTFDDMKDVMEQYKGDPLLASRKDFHQKVYWWQRKDGLGYHWTYETGIAVRIGSDWIIRHNYMHDGVEYLSVWATGWSRNLQVYQNRFERLVDNAIEAEDHAYNERFFDNAIVDEFEPFSWQPLDSLPWPGPIYIYRNVLWMSPENVGIWKNHGWTPGIWKLGAQENENWLRKGVTPPGEGPVTASGEGFLSFNNTIYCPDHEALTRTQKWTRLYANFRIFNNLVVLNDFNSNATQYLGKGLGFSDNVVVFVDPKNPEATAAFTANGGKLVADVKSLGMVDPEHQHFELTETSPARGVKAQDSPPEALPDAGAIPYGQTWQPPVVGPQANLQPDAGATK